MPRNEQDATRQRRLKRELLDSPVFATSIYDAVARLARQLRSAKLPRGLTLERLSTLGAISANEPISLSRLAAMESLSVGAMSRSVGALERQGLVRRKTQADDGRAVLLSTTAKGNRVFAQTLEDYVSHLVETLSTLSEDQRTAIHRILVRLEGFSPGAE